MKTLSILCFVILVSSLSAYSQVSQEWVQRFTSDSIRNENVNDMFVDGSGNVYLTGSQKDRPLFRNIEAVTVKYNSQGDLQWIQNYRSPDSSGAFGRAVYADNSGNVYVTGESNINSGGANRTLVIKYGPDGTQLWSNLFSLSSAYNGGYDIITDADGNVYVTGEYATNVITYNNIFLVKFSPSGNIINQTFYHGRSEGGRKIGMDGSGKIIVGGYYNADSLSFIALKYEQNLDFVWAAIHGIGIGNQSVIDMAIDMNSNIILSGTNSISLDYSVLKISPAGLIEWGRSYNSATGWDISRSVAADRFGNIFVTGQSGISGIPLSHQFSTLKYSATGQQQWNSMYNGGISPDGYIAYSLTLDDSSNVYIVGNKYSNADISTVKLNSSGNFMWEMTYNGTGNSADAGIEIGLDNNRNVYVTGTSVGSNSGYDIVVIKYAQSVIGIQNIADIVPEKYSLSQNYPNPFNPSTSIEFEILTGGKVLLNVFDITGKKISELVNSNLSAGKYRYDFNASGLTSGVYFYTLQTGSFRDTKRMILIK